MDEFFKLMHGILYKLLLAKHLSLQMKSMIILEKQVTVLVCANMINIEKLKLLTTEKPNLFYKPLQN